MLMGIAGALAGGIIAWKRIQRQPFIPTPQMRVVLPTPAPHNAGTALITGASSGIGAAYAQRLAAIGYDLIIVARREDRLQTLATDIEQKHGVSVEVLVADLAVPADVDRVAERIAACDTLTMLVNNAGFGLIGAFADLPIEKHMAMIHVHVLASVRFCHAVLPGMLARGHGSIINVSSIAAFLPRPNNVIYSPTKMYLKTFTEGLREELDGSNIQLQVVFPGLTKTEFFDRPEIGGTRVKVPEFLWMTAEEVVDGSLKALQRGQFSCLPGAKNRLLLFLLRNRGMLKGFRRLIAR
jgi:short-subunit dehydrogenase